MSTSPSSSPATSDDTPPSSFEMDDTIAAIATPPGVGGVGIVRISGPQAFKIGAEIFRPARSSTALPLPSHLLTHGMVANPDSGEMVDEVLAAFMRAPHTYTREDVVEIDAHGGPLVLRHILELALAHGARAARPGEMTLRAFLNGRIDLAQAEAVMALIVAESEAGRRLAMRQLQGELSARVRAARARALDALARIEASIDFPEEEVPPPDPAELAALIAASTDVVSGLLAGADQGRILREGVRVAIVGRPNVGKSSLLNALLGVERAIVTAIPGTTRDTVEERASIAGVALHLVDTAGLTPTDDPIERIGVERSRAAAASADLLLFVVDGSVPLSELDMRAAGELAALDADALIADGAATDGRHEQRPVLLAVNKADLARVVSDADASALWPGARIVPTSAVTDGGTRELAERIAALALGGDVRAGDALVASARHRDALRRAQEHLRAAAETLAAQTPLDFVSIDLRAALESLGEITGETATADLLDRIFAEFCIGK